jgi:exonuclease III
MFATVHIYYGNASKTSDAYQRRIREIESVARFLAKRAKHEDQTYILVGDFNIEKLGDTTADALEQAKFTIVRNNEGSNRTQTKFYDQISFWAREGEVRMANTDRANGVLRLFDTLFRDADFDLYDSDVDATLAVKLEALVAQQQAWEAKKPSKTRTKELASLTKKIAGTRRIRAEKHLREAYYLEEWRTFQLSDHLPLWVELDVDFAEDYLDTL